ncbi:hypothetical protein [Thiofilum flexile]|uniref:hypothetical protein n=1 Tax=Thiofilum flexile TaxID=125627 RepID=UPI00038037BA|nr:hypothetical protein [Thiofilum flexile]
MLKTLIPTLFCSFTLSACGGGSLSSMNTTTSSSAPFVSNNPTLNKLQGEWGRSDNGAAVFKIAGENLIWFKGNKSYPLTLEGNNLVGTITDTRGITCQVTLASAGENLSMGQRNCVDAAGAPLTLAQTQVNFVRVTPKPAPEAMSCEQLQAELNQLETTIKQKDTQYQKLKTNNSAWAKAQRDRLVNDNSYTVYRDLSVMGKQKGCPITTTFDNPSK